MKIETYINPKYWQDYPEDWEFTGRIKYEKYTNVCFVYFEIEYTEKVFIDQSFLDIMFFTQVVKMVKKTAWLTDKDFMLQEIPEITIVEC